MVQLSDVYKRSSQQVSCRIDDEIAILDLERAVYFGLQGAGVQVWDALEQPRSVADICASITAEFDVSPAECEADVVALIANLQEEGLVELAR